VAYFFGPPCKGQYRFVREEALGYFACVLKREVTVVGLGERRRWWRQDLDSVTRK